MLILDTDILVEIEKKNPRVLSSIMELRKDHPEDITITSAVYAEFYFGLMTLSASSREKALASIEFYRLLEFDKHSAKIFGQIKWLLEKDGKIIPLFDLITASIALSHGATIATNDSHYERIPELKIAIIKH